MNQIKLLGCTTYQNLDNQWLIEIPTDHRKLLLQEHKNNKWLLISNGDPQMFLNTRQILQYIKKIQKNPLIFKTKEAAISSK
ncbi:hypothetical protein H1P_1030020 [Hyella patelloides LEGE 07179]|uniref:Uncharacterized protein n=1 Tax=Hyella patelloides LEGE 07179 TaxID=945734 RepID=A0A563VJ59_9CYAN|nr:hypothetical protein H1P_1030020 [Hyella patelloides LEGE 07179]